MDSPVQINDDEYRFDSFTNEKILLNKRKNHLPAMGWNSWNAFGSGNTEALTKVMADKIIELGLDKLGYKYLVLDDGCYKAERVEGQLSNEEIKFPSGFKSLSDYIHSLGLKFGMYNDIGTNLCAGAAVGTCGHEKTDAKSYVDWGVDFLKVDNCYYLWDNATFSDAKNARYVYAPNIKKIKLYAEKQDGTSAGQKVFDAVKDGIITGRGVEKKENYVCGIGTFDGTNTGTTPVGLQSGELTFEFTTGDFDAGARYFVQIEYATAEEPGTGSWLQLALTHSDTTKILYDNFLPPTPTKTTFQESAPIELPLQTLGTGSTVSYTLRIMNHRRQENTLCSYAALLEGLNLAQPNHDIILSLCEWGKTQPQNWGYKVADSWRILNDITFQVGSDGDAGHANWEDPGTPSVTSQYDKAVIMDEFAGLNKGWNDPDMLMVGMNGLTETMCKTHFTMWCLMNSPLMLGLDLRRVNKGDQLYNIIANKDLIALNQDALGIQAKRVYTTAENSNPDKDYIQNNDRVDILAKPLCDGSIALGVINVSQSEKKGKFAVTKADIEKLLGKKMPADFEKASKFSIQDLWTKKEWKTESSEFGIIPGNLEIPDVLAACDCVVLKITPLK